MIETLRHDSVFSCHRFGDKQIDIIGAGAVGSKVAISLSKLGIKNIHIWDFDTVVEHNVANQAFEWADVGNLKVFALKRLIQRACGLPDKALEGRFHDEKVDGSKPLGEIVFLLTDTMSSRKEIWERAIKMKGTTRLMIETRMGVDEGRLYTIIPTLPTHVSEYEKTLYKDEETPVSACGANPSVGPTADIVSGMAVWQLIRWFNLQEGGKNDELENELIFSLRPSLTLSRRF